MWMHRNINKVSRATASINVTHLQAYFKIMNYSKILYISYAVGKTSSYKAIQLIFVQYV